MQADPITAFVAILVLATIVEALVEFLVAPLVDGLPWSERAIDLVLRWTAAGAGVCLCIIYRADLLSLLGLASPVPAASYIVTGLLMGRGANYIHDFGTRWL